MNNDVNIPNIRTDFYTGVTDNPEQVARKTQTAARKAIAKQIDRAKTTLKKRIERLKNNDLQDSPAFKQYMENKDVIAFSVKGKTTQQLQSEYWKLKRLLDMKTGTVKGANEVLKDIAKNTGITYKNLSDLKKKSKLFFDLADKAKNLLESAGLTAQAMDYRKIWNDVNELIAENTRSIQISINSIEDLTENAEKELFEKVMQGLRERIEDELNNEL